MPFRSLNILSISDKKIAAILEPTQVQENSFIDLVLACGDLPYHYIEEIFEAYEVPVLFVRGNHDKLAEYGKNTIRHQPRGAFDLHRRTITINNIIFAGLEGSVRYREGPFMYSQAEMWWNVFSMIPQFLWNWMTQGRFVDVVIAHAPPFGIHDKPIHTHTGFKAFNWLIKTFKPAYFFHGHIHVYESTQTTETIQQNTKIINTYGERKTVIRQGIKHYDQTIIQGPTRSSLNSALDDFRDARRKAALQSTLATLQGKNTRPISFDQIAEHVELSKTSNQGLQSIPVDAIIGSVNRHNDFTSKFFPRKNIDPTRWSRLKQISDATPVNIPPIDVYQIDEVYFVLDGNHRVSIARQKGDTHIKAYVTKIDAQISFSPGENPDDLIIKSQHQRFLQDTRLHESHPEVNFLVSVAGQYRILRELISKYHIQKEFENHYPLEFHEAVDQWVIENYLPTLRIIHQHGIMRDFPNRTPTDLFIWFSQYRQSIMQELGMDIPATRIAENWQQKYSQRISKQIAQYYQSIISRFRPQDLDAGPPPGEWHKFYDTPRLEDRLFSSLLVGIRGDDLGKETIIQAAHIAQLEEAPLTGIHIIPTENPENETKIQEMRKSFYQILNQHQINGDFIVASGNINKQLNQRSKWHDLLVLPLRHAPKDQPLDRIRSGLRSLIQSSSRPILVVPNLSPLKHALLAYDGSEKSNEALYLAAYLTNQWNIHLVVVTAISNNQMLPTALDQAKEYLTMRNIDATYLHAVGTADQVIIATAKTHQCDFIIMGGYGHRPIMEMLLGSTVDRILLKYKYPVLICR